MQEGMNYQIETAQKSKNNISHQRNKTAMKYARSK